MDLQPTFEYYYPQGTLGGQCAAFAEKLVKFGPVGDTLASKLAYVKAHGSTNITDIQIGDVVITNDSEVHGHIFVVNCDMGSKWQVTESNFFSNEKVYHSRLVAKNSPRLKGHIRAPLIVKIISMDYQPFAPITIPAPQGNEAMLCCAYAVIGAIETQEFQQTGIRKTYSRSWLYDHSQHDAFGSTTDLIIAGLKSVGLVLETNMANTSQQLIDEGQAWLAQWSITDDYFIQDPAKAMQVAPLIVKVNTGTYLHYVEKLNDTNYFDCLLRNNSYIAPVTIYPTITQYDQIIIKRKGESMVYFKVKGKPAIYEFVHESWRGYDDPVSYGKDTAGKTVKVIELDQVEFDKLSQLNPI